MHLTPIQRYLEPWTWTMDMVYTYKCAVAHVCIHFHGCHGSYHISNVSHARWMLQVLQHVTVSQHVTPHSTRVTTLTICHSTLTAHPSQHTPHSILSLTGSWGHQEQALQQQCGLLEFWSGGVWVYHRMSAISSRDTIQQHCLVSIYKACYCSSSLGCPLRLPLDYLDTLTLSVNLCQMS